MNRPLVYLSGPISGLSYERAVDWRVYVKKTLAPDIVCIDPMRGKEYLKGMKAMPERFDSGPKISHRDKYDVMRSDALLVNLEECDERFACIRTLIEVGWADAFNKPVFMATGNAIAFSKHDFIKQICSYSSPFLDDVMDELKGFLL